MMASALTPTRPLTACRTVLSLRAGWTATSGRGDPLAGLHGQLGVVDHRDHLDVRRAQHDHDEPARPIREQVRRPVMDHVATGLPERLPRLDRIRRLAL